MAYDVGVRQALVSKGIDGSKVGYNVDNGMVTVDGKDFLRPQKNYNGTTFTDQGSFNQAWQNYSGNQPAPQPGQYVQQPTTAYQNPYDSQVKDTISNLMGRINNQQPIDPYSSPEYAAAQAEANRNAGLSVRQAQEALGQSGFARSTNLADRAQHIQNDANTYLQTQMVPQIVNTLYNRRQQDIGNLQNMVGLLSSQQGVYDTRDQRNFDRGIQEGQLTGNYMNADAKSILQHVLDMKRIAEDPTTTEAGRIEASKQADAYRALLPNYGINPDIVGSGVNLDTATKNMMGAGRTTLAKQGQDAQFSGIYNGMPTLQARDIEAKNALAQAQMENEAAYRQASLGNEKTRLGIEQQNANTMNGYRTAQENRLNQSATTKQATDAAIAQALTYGDYDTAIKDLQKHAAAMQAAGVDLAQVMGAINSRFGKMPTQNPMLNQYLNPNLP